MNSFRGKNILINGKTIYATDAGLTTVAEIIPNYVNSDKTNTFAPLNYVKNSLSLNYLLEGNDPLFSYVFNHDDFITGDYCGINFSSGLLQNYNLTIKPNAPIEVSATIAFWGGTGYLRQNSNWYGLEGTRPVGFTGNPSDVNVAYPLNGSGVYFRHNTGVDLPSLSIQELNYSFSSSPSPIYHAGLTEPKEFNFTTRQAEISILVDSNTGLMNCSGDKTYFDVYLRNVSGEAVMNLPIDGIIYQRNFSANASSPFQNRFSILQTNIIKEFSLSSLSASSTYVGETMTVNGANLDSVTTVKLGSVLLNSFSNTNGTISFQVPKGSKTAKVYLNNDSQTVESSTLTILDSGIVVRSVNPISGSYYEAPQYVDISGQGFYDVERILFGTGISTNFSIISENLLRAYVPTGATYDFIKVVSTDRNTTGTSPFRFVPISNPIAYYSEFDFFTAPVSFTGDHLLGATGVSFNNLASQVPYRQSFNNGISSISVNVPSGNTRGYVRFLSPSGVTKLSNFQFDPEIYITGVNPIAAPTGTALRITGLYLVPELMSYYGAPNYYYVKIGNSEPTRFGKVSHTLLTGVIPTGATSGPISIIANNGGSYTWSGIFEVIPPVQTILGVAPYSIFYPQETRVSGTNFFNIVSVEYTNGYTAPYTGFISGYSVSNDGRYIGLPSTGIGDYITGFNTVNEYGIRIVTEQGDVSFPSAFELTDVRIPGYYANHDFTFAALLSGDDSVQTDSVEYGNWTSYTAELRFPRLSGFNWYNPSSGFAYGVGRDLVMAPGSTGTFYLYTSGSGNVYTRELTGLFRSYDGYTENFIINIATS